MRHDHRSVLSVLLASLAVCACAAEGRLADDNKSVAQIQSSEDLEVYLRTTQNSPFDYMSPAVKQHFLSSLVFTGRGLGSFSYSDLENLPSVQVYQILYLFGAESVSATIAKDPVGGNSSVLDDINMPDYACSEFQGACVPAIGAMCMSNCGG